MSTTIKVPNLDALPPDTLLEVANEEALRRVNSDRSGTPLSPDDYIASTLVELYARTKFAAMQARAEGMVMAAISMERAGQCFYRGLPRELRW
jgi:hypothetical protein